MDDQVSRPAEMLLVVICHTGCELICHDGDPAVHGCHVVDGLKGLGSQHGLGLVLHLHMHSSVSQLDLALRTQILTQAM